MKNKNPFTFFLLIYLLSTPFWIVGSIYNENGFLPLNIPFTDIFAAFAPILATYYFVKKEKGKREFKNLLLKSFNFKSIDKNWYLKIFTIITTIYVIIYALCKIFGLPLPNSYHLNWISLPFLFIFFFLAAILEEIAYTGYILEPTQKKYGALVASLIIGVLWSIWHYPSMIEQGKNAYWIFWGTLGTIAARVIYVWLYNNTGKSLFACILMHTLFNFGRVIFPTDQKINPLLDYPKIHYLTIVFIAIIILFFWKNRNTKII